MGNSNSSSWDWWSTKTSSPPVAPPQPPPEIRSVSFQKTKRASHVGSFPALPSAARSAQEQTDATLNADNNRRTYKQRRIFRKNSNSAVVSHPESGELIVWTTFYKCTETNFAYVQTLEYTEQYAEKQIDYSWTKDEEQLVRRLNRRPTMFDTNFYVEYVASDLVCVFFKRHITTRRCRIL